MSDKPTGRRWRIRLVTRYALIRIAILLAIIGMLVAIAYFLVWRMPGKSYAGPLPELTPTEWVLEQAMRDDVRMLAVKIGERNLGRYDRLTSAADFITTSFVRAGYQVNRHAYEIDGRECANLEVQLTGARTQENIVVVGAHYDTVLGCPGANDNASGVAGVLALARIFADRKPGCTLRFLAFVNEEPPYFLDGTMGSLVYARACKARNEKITAMLSLETIGYYSDELNSQQFPAPFLESVYGNVGNFIGFVGNFGSRDLVQRCVGAFRENAQFPSHGAALPEFIPGAGWSDHWSFWQCGYKAIMVTDTAPFRYVHYHLPTDTADQLNYANMARVIAALVPVIEKLYE